MVNYVFVLVEYTSVGSTTWSTMVGIYESKREAVLSALWREANALGSGKWVVNKWRVGDLTSISERQVACDDDSFADECRADRFAYTPKEDANHG